jgi:hypothetical protein
MPQATTEKRVPCAHGVLRQPTSRLCLPDYSLFRISCSVSGSGSIFVLTVQVVNKWIALEPWQRKRGSFARRCFYSTQYTTSRQRRRSSYLRRCCALLEYQMKQIFLRYCIAVVSSLRAWVLEPLNFFHAVADSQPCVRAVGNAARDRDLFRTLGRAFV